MHTHTVSCILITQPTERDSAIMSETGAHTNMVEIRKRIIPFPLYMQREHAECSPIYQGGVTPSKDSN